MLVCFLIDSVCIAARIQAHSFFNPGWTLVCYSGPDLNLLLLHAQSIISVLCPHSQILLSIKSPRGQNKNLCMFSIWGKDDEGDEGDCAHITNMFIRHHVGSVILYQSWCDWSPWLNCDWLNSISLTFEFKVPFSKPSVVFFVFTLEHLRVSQQQVKAELIKFKCDADFSLTRRHTPPLHLLLNLLDDE